MEKIQHYHVEVRGLKLHVAEIGSGPKTVLLLHGFPEIWYIWRYQMIALAKAGYRAIAFDFGGYGLSDQPPKIEKASYDNFVNDAIGIMDALDIKKTFLFGKDFGAMTAYMIGILYPERVLGVASVGVAFMVPNPAFVKDFEDVLPKGFYVTRFREPGRQEADFARFDAKSAIRNLYTLFSSAEIPIAGDDQEIMDLYDPSIPLPSWFSENDLENYASLYEKSGFNFAMQVPYRSLTTDCGLSNKQLLVPSLLIQGEKDYVLKFPGLNEYIRGGAVKRDVPDLEIIYVPEGSHFVSEQFPEKVNDYLIAFLAKHGA